ncbi:MAG: class I SAM-dependent methyltransferase [Candidatus Bathyarchaeia archaeon]
MKYVYDGRLVTEQELLQIIKESSNLDRVKIALRWVDGKRILDIGCGIGYVAFALANDNSKEIHGFDLLPTNISIAKRFLRKSNISYYVMDATNIGFKDSSFDCALCLEVLEHLKNPAACLQEIHRILKPGGHLIVSTPNAVSSSSILRGLSFLSSKRLVFSLKNIEKEKQLTGTQLDHIYTWDILTLYRLLNRCGFSYVDHAFIRLSLPIFRKVISSYTTNLRHAFHEIILLKVRKLQPTKAKE